MLQNENIICVSYSTWEGPYTKSVVQLMSLLALKNRVLYAEYPFTVKDLIYSLFGKQDAPVRRMIGLRSRAAIIRTKEGAEVISWVLPPLIPVNAIRNDALYKLILKIDTGIYRRSLARAARKFSLGNPVVINAYNPIFGEQLNGKLGEKAHIYYCYDGYATDRRGIRAWQADRRFAGQAGAVIVTSEFLRSEKLPLSKNVAIVKNGVDFDLFSPAAKTAPRAAGGKRKVGYIGSIDQRFDLDTVEYAVKNLPAYDFEFTGDVRNAAVKVILEKYSNVTFLPPVSPAEVPERLSRCDAGIIPYRCTEINRNVYPLKINEYLAVGVPVVLTRFADLPEFENHAYFASSKEEFTRMIASAVETDNPGKIAARIGLARANSWQARAESFAAVIETLLNQNKQV